MQGIFGLITKRPPDEAKADIDGMLCCVRHESFYVTGSYSMESQGLYVGWAVHEGSFSDCMPILDPTRNRTMFFSGQNFSHEDLLNGLRSRGHSPDFRDASYLLDAYNLDEQGFFSSLNGWFCAALR
jgi:asparagine synthase (glutamine-hydrolysing)